MAHRSRRRQRFVINRRWTIGMLASIVLVVAGIVGIVELHGMWVYAGLAVAVVGAVSAMLQTFVRDHAGDEIS